MSQNMIINSLKDSFFMIYKNKLFFILLFLIELLFIFAFVFVTAVYSQKMLESAKAMSDYLSQQKLDDISIASSIQQQKNILGDDPLSISRNFNDMVKNFKFFIFSILALLVFSLPFVWTLTSRLANQNQNFGKLFLRNLMACALYLALIFLFFYLLSDISLSSLAFDLNGIMTKYLPFFVFSIVLAYFMLISLALPYNIELKNILQKTLALGIKKAHYILAAYLINILIFFISISLLFYSLEGNLFFSLIASILFVFSFVFGRMFLINVIERLERIP